MTTFDELIGGQLVAGFQIGRDRHRYGLGHRSDRSEGDIGVHGVGVVDAPR